MDAVYFNKYFPVVPLPSALPETPFIRELFTSLPSCHIPKLFLWLQVVTVDFHFSAARGNVCDRHSAGYLPEICAEVSWHKCGCLKSKKSSDPPSRGQSSRSARGDPLPQCSLEEPHFLPTPY